MKKTLFFVFLLILIVGAIFISQKQFFPKSENLENFSQKTNALPNQNNVYYLEYSTSYAIDLKNVEAMYNAHEFIAIIYVDKLYPASTYREKTDEYIMPFTSGEATILKALKGNFANEKISFIRLGGEVSYQDYEKSLPPAAREKFGEIFTEREKKTTLINNKSKGDIDIEGDKTYLVYMNRSDEFHNKNEFTIEAFEYGLREINLNYNTLNINSTNLTIKNNETGEYETLEKAVSGKIVEQLKRVEKQ